MRLVTCVFLFVMSVLPLHLSAAAVIEIGQSNAGGLYKVGDTVTWTVQAKGLDQAKGTEALCTVFHDGKTVLSKETIDFKNGDHTFTAKIDKPGSIFVRIELPQKGGKALKKEAGALVEAASIQPSMPVPDDFDEFWKQQIARQAAIPMNPVLSKEKEVEAGIESYVIKMDTINDQHINGRLVKKVGDQKMPALLIVQWAGVYGLHPYWSIPQARRGFLTLNILAHDLPIDKDKAFYAEQKNGALKGYTKIGNDDRETSYFLRMFLSCVRGVEYLKQHPQWNGEVLMVTGGSQGGYQAFVTAGLCPDITAVVVNVPAGCDHTASEAGRALTWPFWLYGDEQNQKKIQASRYYDGVNFASRIKCPALVGFNLGDPVSRCEGIMAAINQMQGPVEMAITPDGNHSGPHKAYGPRAEAWFNAAVNGKTLPVKPYK